MSEPSTPAANPQPSDLFREPEKAPPPTRALVVAGIALAILVVFLVLMSRRKPETENASYAPNIVFSHVEMSESTSLSGGKSTYIDGHVKNNGKETVTGINVRVLFRNDEAMPPQVQNAPVMLIRSREPYVDTQTVSAQPILPGDEREFRLTFENVATNWNQQLPEIQVTGVKTR